MANPEHEEILKKGVDYWNQWRKDNSEVLPDLRGAVLCKRDLRNANLSTVNLSDANLNHANLCRANLNFSDLREAKVNNADLRLATLHSINLREANLRETNFSQANLSCADLIKADLVRADLRQTNLTSAYFMSANLKYANLMRADLTNAKLGNLELEGAILDRTHFSDVDLSQVKGLETCNFSGPCAVDHLTLMKSGVLPEIFLRGCGFPDQFIDYLPSLLGSLEPIQTYTCFISHSSKDKEFVGRLYADLQAKGVRCWYSVENFKPGDEISSTIDQAIRVYEKLLLIFSDSSITSTWVKKEAHEAMTKETKKGEKDVLFPIRLDDSIMETMEQWADDIKRERYIGDFTNWKDHDSYQKSFKRLLRELGKEEKPDG